MDGLNFVSNWTVIEGIHANIRFLGKVELQENKIRTWLQQTMSLQRYDYIEFLYFPSVG
jgi:hypothetical protein